MKYIIVSPVKNEANHINLTLDSVINQSIKPVEWVIVDDGSSDETLSILNEYQEKYSWIKVYKKDNYNEERSGGAKVVRAFNYGLKKLKCLDYDFLVKLDGDLKLPERYFEEVINTFHSDEKIGICGGYILNKYGDKLIMEGKLDYHVRGAFKSVRKQCFEEICGFKEIWNWDGMDQMEAFRLGWKTKVFNTPVVHYKPTSSAYNPIKFHFKCGLNAYKLRNNIILVLLRALGKIKTKPIILTPIIYLLGYIYAFIIQEPKLIDKELGQFTNKFHINRIYSLLLRK